MPIDLDIRPHALQFADMHEAVFKNGLGNPAGSFSLGHQSHELGLHIRREPRKDAGPDINRLNPLGADHPQATILFQNFHPGTLQFADQGFEVLTDGILHHHVAARDCRRDHEGSGLDPVGDDPA